MKRRSYYTDTKGSPYLISYVPGITGKDLMDILDMMIHGVDISLVDPKILSHLDDTIALYKEQSITEHDTLALSKLNFYQKYIKELPRKQQIASLLAKEIPPPPYVPPALSPEQVEEEVKQILENNKIKYYKPDELDLVLEGLRKKKSESIAKGDYLEAQKAEHYTRAVLSYGQLGYVENLQNSKVTDLQAKLDEARESLQQKKQHWEELHHNLKMAAKEELAELQETHEYELRELEAQYDIEPPLSIIKYSNTLLTLRRKEEIMIKKRKFREADELKNIADELEEKENIDRAQRWKELLDLKVKNLKQKQEKFLQGRKNHWKKEETMLVNQANKEVEKDEKAIEHLEKNLKLAKEAKSLASNMKEESINIKYMESNTKKSTLPPLESPKSSTSRAIEHRQRAILNHKIYTRLHRSKSQLT